MAALHLTPEILRATYDFFCTTLPFRRWNLPSSEVVGFKVTGDKTKFGCCATYDIERKNNKEKEMLHVIEVSNVKVLHTGTLLVTMAHEMVHVHLDRKKVRAHHGADFKRCAKRICQVHGFDLLTF